MRNSFMLAASTVLLAMPGVAQEEGWQADAVAKALDYHVANRPKLCIKLDPSQTQPASFELQIGEETAARPALIVEFPCQIGAYSVTSVYLLSDQHGTVSEIVFPFPKFDIEYDQEGADQTVKNIVIYETPYRREVCNPSYDASSRTMSERNNWREQGDAYTETRWGFKHGKFEISYFAVDATFNGEDDPIVLIDRDIW